MTAEVQHHRYSASGAEGWLICAGKIAMERGLKESYSPYADVGSAAHYLASVCLLEGSDTDKYAGDTIVCWELPGERDGQSFLGQSMPEGAKERSRWEVTDEMVLEVDKYVQNIRRKVNGGKLFVERRVEFGTAVGLAGAFGTTDVAILSADLTTLYIDDLKYGYSPVEAELNPQEMLYAIGTIFELENEFYDLSKLETLVLTIHQPRINNCPSWEVSLTEKNDDGETILEWFAGVCKKAIQRSEEALSAAEIIQALPSSEIMSAQRAWFKEYLKPSEKGCKWCKAGGFCVARTEESLSTMLVTTATADGLYDLDAPVLDQVQDLEAAVRAATKQIGQLSFAEIERANKALDAIDDWKSAMAARLHSELMAGERSAEFKLVTGREGNRAWRDKKEAEEAMKAMRLKVDEMYSRTVITAPVAEKLLAKKRPKLWKRLEGLIGRSAGKTIVVPMSDKRPPINPYADLPQLPDLDAEDRKVNLQDLLPDVDLSPEPAMIAEAAKTKKKQPVVVPDEDEDFI